jgi:hypothetical protein
MNLHHNLLDDRVLAREHPGDDGSDPLEPLPAIYMNV